jgi:hypothetical protein
MRFARIVFTFAGIWGLVVLTPLLFLSDYVGRQYPPAITHRDFFFGFLLVALAWQIAFLIIGRDPVRFRPLMIAAMLEKFPYVAALVVLYGRGELPLAQFAPAALSDLTLGVLFVAAFVRTGAAPRPS